MFRNGDHGTLHPANALGVANYLNVLASGFPKMSVDGVELAFTRAYYDELNSCLRIRVDRPGSEKPINVPFEHGTQFAIGDNSVTLNNELYRFYR